MHGLIREEGSFGANPSAKDLAKHLYTRMYCDKIVIVAEKPKILLPALRKQWLKLARNVHTERAGILDATRVYELTEIISHMHNLRFTTNYPPDDYPGDVYITTPDEVLQWPPECRTMYLACKVEAESLYKITAWMPEGGLVVNLKIAK